ncbi:MAG TPA: hypothetical protein VF384_12480 [Planctomycetota bacterium]
MRNLAAIALSGLVLASVASAQTFNCPLGQPLTSPNQGNPNGGLYFNLTVNVPITFLNLNYVASEVSPTGPSSLNLFVGPSTWVNNVSANPGPWTLVASTTPVNVTTGVDTPVTGVLNPAGPNPGPVCFEPGNYGIVLQAVGHSWGYQNGLFTFNSPGGEFSCVTGGASNAFLTLPTFSPRSINGSIDYQIGGTPMPFARRTPYGAGCYNLFQSFYEMMPSTATGQDLANKTIRLTFDGVNNRWSNVNFVTPVPIVPPVSASLGHGNDTNITVNLVNSQPILFPNIGGIGVATSTVEMCSNGYITLLGTNPVTANPTVAGFLSGSPRIGNWVNLDPTTGGTTHYDYEVATATHLFTWQGVNLSGIAASPNSFQIAFIPNGDVEIRYGAMSVAGGGAWPTLVGFTPGGNSADPGTIDLSVALPISTAPVTQPPLALAASTNPVLGAIVDLTTSNATGLSFGINFISLSDLPPFSPVGFDLGIIGAPGCVANVDINQGISTVISNIGPPLPPMLVSLPIPNTQTILGLNLYSQSIWLDATQNPFGMLTSNGMNLKVGAF